MFLNKILFRKKREEKVEREFPEGFEQDNEESNEIPPWSRQANEPRLEEYQERVQQYPQQRMESNSHEIILAKLDVINAKLDSINQRLINLENRREERPSVKW